ncbi:hypothetical protein ACU8KH_02415 [Lachancea thermotolerans]
MALRGQLFSAVFETPCLKGPVMWKEAPSEAVSYQFLLYILLAKPISRLNSW